MSGGVENPDRIVASYQCPVCDYNTKKKDHFARHMKQVRYRVFLSPRLVNLENHFVGPKSYCMCILLFRFTQSTDHIFAICVGNHSNDKTHCDRTR